METRINYLVRQYYFNKASYEELQEFFDVVQSARHDESIARTIRALYMELRRAHPSSHVSVDREGNLHDLSDLLMSEIRAARPASPVRSGHRRWRWVAAAVVWLAIGISGGYFFWSGSDSTEQTQDEGVLVSASGRPEGEVATSELIIEKAERESRLIYLSDGTKVWLNAASSLKFPAVFDSTQRRVVHLSGEAYFEVEKATQWPFVVHADDVRTTVVGTSFNVKAYPEMADVEVSVRTGRVVVSKKDHVLATLSANQELKVPLFQETFALRERVLTEKTAGSWTAGFLEYEDESIGSILSDLERIYQIQIDLQRAELGPQLITLSAKKESGAKHMLEVICSLTNSILDGDEDVYTIR